MFKTKSQMERRSRTYCSTKLEVNHLGVDSEFLFSFLKIIGISDERKI